MQFGSIDAVNCGTMKYIPIIYLILFSTSIQGQSDSARFEAELNLTLKDTNRYNVVNSDNAILTNDSTFINIAEAILFEVYVKANIRKQMPYKTYHIKHYWVMDGTLPTSYKGGTFRIVMDDRNCRVIDLIHGK